MFYTTDFTDIGIKEVKQYFVSNEAPKDFKAPTPSRRNRLKTTGPMVFMVSNTSENFKPEMNKAMEIKFIDCYPTTLQGLEFDISDGNVQYLTAQVTFKYTMYKFIQ